MSHKKKRKRRERIAKLIIQMLVAIASVISSIAALILALKQARKGKETSPTSYKHLITLVYECKMKKTILCAIFLIIAIVAAFCFNWSRPAAIAVFIVAIVTLAISIPEIRSTIYEIKRDQD